MLADLFQHSVIDTHGRILFRELGGYFLAEQK